MICSSIVILMVFLFKAKNLYCAEMLFSGAALTGSNLPNPLPTLVSNLLATNNGRLVENVDLNRGKADFRTLRYASVITRHGSRSPTETYPKDAYPYLNVQYWPDGPGQLTRYGKQQLYSTGQSLRMRYNGFISINYFYNETLVKTNPYDRDFMSAACLLAGLYPPTGYQLWNPSILWQPIPIWEDHFDVADLAGDPKYCPKYTKEQTKILADKEKVTNHTSLYSYLSKYTGRNITKMIDITALWDILHLQQENGYKLPKWTKKVYPEKLAPVYAETLNYAIAGTPEMRRLAAGPILEMISTQLNIKAKGEMNPNRVMFIEAAHDVTLIALLGGLGFANPFLIDTSAYMVFELHENSDGHSVKVFYFNNSGTVEPTLLDAPKCRSPCTLQKFTNLVKKLSPKDWKSECELSE